MKNIKRTRELDALLPDMIKLYKNGSGLKDVASFLNIPVDCVRTRLVKSGIIRGKAVDRQKRNALSLNVEYFKTIDNPDKAYWLGFITADGTVDKSGYKVSITSKDADIVYQ